MVDTVDVKYANLIGLRHEKSSSGTAADIIEFFDSFKDKKIADEPILVYLTLSIWSWSLMQFTIVLTATRSRKPRGATSGDATIDEEYGSHSFILFTRII